MEKLAIADVLWPRINIVEDSRMKSIKNEVGYVRLADILKVFPVSKSTWWEGVRIQRYPRPIKLGPRMTAWRKSDIAKLLEDPEANNYFPD